LQTIIPKIENALIYQELILIEKDFKLFSRDKFDVFIVPSTLIPNILKEIGRLRETTFREVGEGTGKEIDIDEYDIHYHQLFLWDRKNQKIVGGYRMGLGKEIFENIGANGFYINSLFFVKEDFFPIMKKSVELGRSFVIKEYQKERLPLFLLWKGIFEFLKLHTEYQYLYGPLSISKFYSNISRSLIIRFVKLFLFDKKMAKMLKAKTPFEKTTLSKDIIDFLKESKGKLHELDDFIQTINPIKLKLPVLMKQYLKQNAKFIGFNLDPNFSDALDGFMILDVSKLPPKTIEMLNQEKS